MSVSLSPKDLQTIFALVVTAEVKLGSVPACWQSIQNLENAAKSGLTFVPESAPVAEPNGNR